MHMSSSLETADLTLEELGGRAGKTQRAGHAEVRPILINDFESWPPFDRRGMGVGGGWGGGAQIQTQPPALLFIYKLKANAV